MNKIILALVFLLLSFPSYAYAAETNTAAVQECKVIRVVDGDTLEVPLSCLPRDMKLFVRVNGLDTPEKGGRAKCESEAQLALKASAFTKKLVQSSNSVITITDPSWDKYGGRMLGTVLINNINLTQELIKNKLAREYHGELKKSWCQ